MYSTRSGRLVVHRDVLAKALFKNVISSQLYTYYTERNNLVFYSLHDPAFVAGHCGEDSGRGGGNIGGDGEKTVGVDTVLQIAVPSESFRDKDINSYTDGIALYLCGMVVSAQMHVRFTLSMHLLTKSL